MPRPPGPPMSIRASGPWMGATRVFRCPVRASRRVGMCTSRTPSAPGRSRSINPCGKAIQRPRRWWARRFGDHRLRPPARGRRPRPPLSRGTLPSGGWTGPPRGVDLAKRLEGRRILVGRGAARQAAHVPPPGASLPPDGGRETHSLQGAACESRAPDQTENARPDLPPPERGLPPPRGEARPEAPFRVQGASPTTRGRPAASSGWTDTGTPAARPGPSSSSL